MELAVGRVVKAHGVTGEVVVEVRTDDPEIRFVPGAALRAKGRDDRRRDYVIDTVRVHGGRLLMRLDGVADRDTADALRGSLFVVDSEDLPPIEEPDTYYDHQLEGLRVRTTAGCDIGTVAEVLHTAAGELLAVNRGAAGELLVPFVSAIVTSVSMDTRTVEIDPPEGLLELGTSGRIDMKIDVVTIFPSYLDPLRQSLPGKAIESGLVQLDVHDLRAWAHDVHRSVDDAPYGGGPGMLMTAPVWGEALDEICSPETVLIVPTPAGALFTQATAQRWSSEAHLVFACGRYEGIDQRVIDDAARRMRVEEVSIGDYVLPGGESAALVIIEAVLRLLPNVLGNPQSHQDDSHSPGTVGLLEGPSYTRPPSWRGLDVPEILLSGDHARIDAWRRQASEQRTRARRPDLIDPVRSGPPETSS